MKYKLLALAFILYAFRLSAQVQIDKDIQLNGTSGNRDITGAQTMDVSVGYLFGNSPGTSGQVLRSNGTAGFVAASIVASDLPDLSGSYIKNQTTQQPTSNFNISGAGVIGTSLRIDNADANSGTTANALTFGASGSGEGIGSKRTATGNQFGLDFYTGGTNRLSITNLGNVGIGGISANKLTVIGNVRFGTSANNYVYLASGATAGNGGLEIFTLSNIAYIRYHDPSVAWRDIALNDQGGNVGIGTTTIAEKLDVNGNIKASGIVYWGNATTRTESRPNAGLRGDVGAKSGFFETDAPSPAANWYPGASSWQHMIDVRHSNNGNNYALQIAGSFFNQRLYFRKTNDNAAGAWSEIQNTALYFDNGVGSESADVTTGSPTVFTTGNLDVRNGERYKITVLAEFRNTGGSGSDNWRLIVNRTGCSLGEIGRNATGSGNQQDHNGFYTYSLDYIWIANCDGIVSFNGVAARLGDDTWKWRNAKVIVSRF